MRFGFSGRSCGSVRDSWRFLDRAPPRVAAAGHDPSFSYGAEGNAADPPREKHHGTLFLHRAARDLVGATPGRHAASIMSTKLVRAQ